MSAPLMAGAVMPAAVRSAQFPVVTAGDGPAGSVGIWGAVLLGPGEVVEMTVRPPPPPPHATSAAVSARISGMRKVFIFAFI